jgi:hypothetical protein
MRADLQELIAAALEKTNFSFGEVAVRNEGQYLRMELKYTSAFPTGAFLRPYLLLEFTASKIHLATKKLVITTLIEDTLGNVANFEPCTLRVSGISTTVLQNQTILA